MRRAAGLLVLLMLLAPLGGNALVRYVESRIPSQSQCAAASAASPGPHGTMPDTIVLLSAGFEWNPAVNDPYVALAPESWRRLRAAVHEWRYRPGSELVIAGGGPFAIKESVVLALLAQDWGIQARAIRIETRSTTTWESAFELRATTPRRIRLLSSALHLPRALIAFHAAGFRPCAQPSDSDYQPPGGFGYYLPQRSGLEESEAAIYELIGTVVYRARARRLKSADTDAGHPPPP